MEIFLLISPHAQIAPRQLDAAAWRARVAGLDGVAVGDEPIATDGNLSAVDPLLTCAALAAGPLAACTMRLVALNVNTCARPVALTLLAAHQLAHQTGRRFELGLGVGSSGDHARALGLRWCNRPGPRFAELERQMHLLEHMGQMAGAHFDAPATSPDFAEMWRARRERVTVPAAPALADVPLIVGGSTGLAGHLRFTRIAAHPRVREFAVVGLPLPATEDLWTRAQVNRATAGPPLRLSAAVNLSFAGGPAPTGQRHWISGSLDEMARAVAAYGAAGAHRLYLRPADVTSSAQLSWLAEVATGLRVNARMARGAR